jgi:hypothetical protein
MEARPAVMSRPNGVVHLMAVVYCHKCGTGNAQGRGACLMCYAPLADVGTGASCLVCGGENPGKAIFCGACGVRIGETTAPQQVAAPMAAAPVPQVPAQAAWSPPVAAPPMPQAPAAPPAAPIQGAAPAPAPVLGLPPAPVPPVQGPPPAPSAGPAPVGPAAQAPAGLDLGDLVGAEGAAAWTLSDEEEEPEAAAAPGAIDLDEDTKEGAGGIEAWTLDLDKE